MKKIERIVQLESQVEDLQEKLERTSQIAERLRDDFAQLADSVNPGIDSLAKQVNELQQWVRILKPTEFQPGQPQPRSNGHGPGIPLPKPRSPFPQDPEVWLAANTSKETGSRMPVVQATTADECGDVRDLPSPPIAAEAAL